MHEPVGWLACLIYAQCAIEAACEEHIVLGIIDERAYILLMCFEGLCYLHNILLLARGQTHLETHNDKPELWTLVTSHSHSTHLRACY